MTQEEIRQRLRFRCKHKHNGLRHPQCYKDRKGKVERVGFCDIESSNLNATFGIVYTYCIKELDGPLIKRAISLDDLHAGLFDKNLLKQFCEDAKKFDRLVFHYGVDRKFDAPFLRTRAEYWKLPFPIHAEMFASDTHTILRNKFRLHSNRLQTASDFFGIPAKGHKLNSDIWLQMITGNKKRMQKAINYILTHNIEDVLSTEMLWKRIAKYARVGRTSI